MSTEQREHVEAILRQSAFPAGSDVNEQRRQLRELLSAQPLPAGGEGRRLGPLDAASFAADGDGVLVRAAAGAAHVVLIAGRPAREQGRARG